MQTGALTFLFTDIEGSTRQWEADPVTMSAALARHDEILGKAIAEAGGAVFKHTGDGMCAVFRSATAALTGALGAQRRLAAGPLRVRMALHSGDAEERGGDWFGPTLNRAARLMAAAWGGQILVSAATAELAGDGLPPGAALVDLDVHRLADLTRPERIFQLDVEGLASAFPPLRTFSARRSNLPMPLTRFVGRRGELGDVADHVKRSRLVTLTGVGGAGKTRLAIEAARRTADDFPDGTFFTDFAPITDPQMVPAAVATGLGLILDEPGPVAEHLAAYLERRTTLLVLDNCEHVVDAAAALADTLLRTAPGVVVLATSREPLGIPGETVWRIPPLAAEDAVELVCERARSAEPGFSPSADDRAALERICARLDGLPLALELAAARLHVLSPAEVAERLDDCFRLLTGGARTAVDRHRTLRATVDWGYDVLDEPGRALLRRLSVFAGGFDLPGAEAVGGPDALDLVSGLVDRSWVAVEPPDRGPTRYRLIETIRQYAAEKLAETGEAAAAREAHCRHYRSLSGSLDENDILGIDPAWLARVRLDEDNLRTALEWATDRRDAETCLALASAMISHLAFNGRAAEGVRWLERALAMNPAGTDRRTIIAKWMLGAYLPLAGDSDSGERVLREAVKLAESEPSPALAANIRTSLARQLASIDPDRAVAVLAAGTPAGDGGDEAEPIQSIWSALNRGWVALAVGDPAAAEHWFGLARRQAETEIPYAHAAAALAPLRAARGDAEQASALAEEAIGQARATDLPLVLVMALTRAAEASIVLGRPAEAAERLAESARILRDVGTTAWVGDTLKLAAIVAAHSEAHDVAARLLGAAGHVDDATGDPARPLTPGADLAASRARRALGPARFTAGLNAGAELDRDAALALVLTTALDHRVPG